MGRGWGYVGRRRGWEDGDEGNEGNGNVGGDGRVWTIETAKNPPTLNLIYAFMKLIHN